MVVYHYCLSYQKEVGALIYTHGSVEVERPLVSNDEYTRLVENLAERAGIERSKLVVLALNPL